jgi:hypothetical protein
LTPGLGEAGSVRAFSARWLARSARSGARRLDGEERLITDPWRVRVGTFKRHNLLRAKRLVKKQRMRLRGTDEPPVRPVFIIGCPRSGTSLVYTLLGRHEAFRSLEGEGHLLWNAYQHPRRTGWSSDRATGADVRPGEARYLYTLIREIAGDHRFLDKTPKNVLKVPYLRALFADATFLLLKRDGRDVVNSLIEGWEVRQTPSYRLPRRLELADYKGRYWCFVLPPGWRDLAQTSIADVAAHQYASSYETALADLGDVEPERIVELAFEDLLARPVVEAARLLESLGLPPSDAVVEMAGRLSSTSIQSNSPPRPEKWRDRAEVIARVLPRIAPIMERLGYEARV